ncbi:MAG: DUF3380 domain-containing protein [Hyphomonadaceae bacterium]|nr:DUF3380 domain-containing protein [Hyphomonadaceae bacterium]
MKMLWDVIVSLLLALFTRAPAPRPAPSRAPAPPAPAPMPAPPPLDFLASLKAIDASPLASSDYIAAAQRLGCEWQALAAVAEVESGREGAFGPDGRPIILYERHLFARKTGGLYNLSHPHLSQPRPGGYPTTQSARWTLLQEAYALNPEAALESASWGRFQVLGQNYPTLHMASARDYVAKLARSEKDQLEAFEAFIVANGLAGALQRRDWTLFARRYNGPNYAENRYDQKMAEAYQRLIRANVA